MVTSLAADLAAAENLDRVTREIVTGAAPVAHPLGCVCLDCEEATMRRVEAERVAANSPPPADSEWRAGDVRRVNLYGAWEDVVAVEAWPDDDRWWWCRRRSGQHVEADKLGTSVLLSRKVAP